MTSALATYLRKKKLSKLAFARRIGVHDTQVGRWLRGERKPSAEIALRIERVTGGLVTLSDLYGRCRPSRRSN